MEPIDLMLRLVVLGVFACGVVVGIGLSWLSWLVGHWALDIRVTRPVKPLAAEPRPIRRVS